MLELIALFTVLALAGLLAVVVVGVAWLAKLVVRVALFPITLLGCLLQGVLGAVAVIVGLTLLFTLGLPILLAVAALLPLLLAVAALVALAWAAIALLGCLV